MHRNVILSLAGLALSAAAPLMAADGGLDSTFATDAEFPGYGIHYGLSLEPLATNDLMRTLPAPDGRIYLVGVMADGQNTLRFSIMRTTPNGPRDYEFGEAGLRTYPLPCNASGPADAQIDTLGRLWVAYSKCADVQVYRFTPEGELDTSLLGSGFLTVDFPDGEMVFTSALSIATTPTNGILVAAGIASNGQNPRLAVARYDADGAPTAGFGDAGITSVPLPIHPARIHHAHLMDNGRVVVDGTFNSPGTTYVVRLLANGVPDAGFGNLDPGVSTADFQTLINAPLESPEVHDSVLLRDGPLVQAGFRVRSGTESNRDFMIVKWRPDGLLDNGVGPAGHRSYALDFGGPNPDQASWNWDVASQIVRQGDGKFLLIGKTWQESQGYVTGMTALRLDRHFNVDTGFGQNSKVLHALQLGGEWQENTMEPVDVHVVPGRILVGVKMLGATYYNYQTIIGLENDLLFADTYD